MKKIHEHMLRFFNKRTFNLLWNEVVLRGTVFVQTHCLLQLHKHLQKITMILTEISVKIPTIKLTAACHMPVSSQKKRH